jgi:2-polyprenyl-3-methyl-5-hydroxy-6-metoxy-1,4-benzoquinol methylase
MIIHKLIAHHLAHKDDPAFYRLQAQDAIRWIEESGVELSGWTEALDLGAGHGVFGAELLKKGCQVTFADETNSLPAELRRERFQQINLDCDDVRKLGTYDLVICSNVLEHLAKPFEFINAIEHLLKPAGRFYLSWTNWLSPWGGHEFSPFHYLGAKRGHLVHDKLTRRQRLHTPSVNLFPTYIGRTLRKIRKHPRLRLVRAAPRYYPEFSFIVRMPLLREFLTWNCSTLIARR